MATPKEVAAVKRALTRLQNNWPDGLMLFANGGSGNIVLCAGHPEDGGRTIATYQIPADGGDPDWNDNESVDFVPTRSSAKFDHPVIKVPGGPRPSFVDKKD